MVTRKTLIVGGSSGIGLQMVRNCIAAGETVTVWSRTWEHSSELPSVKHVEFDATAENAADGIEIPDQIHSLAYCPGSINLKSIRALSVETLREDFELNVVGAVRVVQACIKGLMAAASQSQSPSGVVLFSTVAVGHGIPMHASVAASKGAIEGLTRTIAADLSPQVRVNCVAPALTNTPLAANFFSSDEKTAALGKMYPLGRTGQAEDVAALACFLMGENSGWITGQIVGVDGGMSAIKK